MKLWFKKHKIEAFLVMLLVMRLVLNALMPLMDKTEARYGEIARIMAETKDWVVPHVDYGVPFLAKPPLATWLSVVSLKMFGVNEFAVRFPAFLLAIFLIVLIKKYARRLGVNPYLPGIILLTIPEFFLHSGVVSTDMTLAFCIALVMLSFWEVINGNRLWYWKHLFFISIGLGLLAKGPILLILTFPPIIVWCWWFKVWRRAFKLFRWSFGIVLVLLIALPWYFYAEVASPGFIDYFIVGEHFQRFFDSSWKGDRYGFPKQQPLGMIWVFLIVFALPWIQLLVFKLMKNRRRITGNRWVAFLVLWLTWLPLFFTMSRSLIHPYILPVMVPIALLIVYYWKTLKFSKTILSIMMSLYIIVFFVVVFGMSFSNLQYNFKSDKYFIEQTEKGIPLYHFLRKSYSSQFYSNGTVKAMGIDALSEKMGDNDSFYLIVKKKERYMIPNKLLNHLEVKMKNHDKIMLFRKSKIETSL